jgi:S1-C subfamily serine protease
VRSRSLLPAVALTAVALGLLAVVPLVAEAQRAGRKEIIRSTMPGVVMVLAVKSEEGRLRPVSSGSGTIVSADGSVLTNHHVIYDAKAGKLHDLFVIGRFRAADREPDLVCVGRPDRSRLKPSLDLALIKCDTDMDLKPKRQSGWPLVPIGRSEEIVPGEQILVLGYPGVGGSTIQVTEGLLSGWMDEGRGTSKRAYMKTDADITHGNSGGTAIDETGKLVGVPTAFRVTTAQQGEVTVTAGKVGLIRPIEHARDLLDVASAGWSPTADGDEPDSPEPRPLATGVRIRTTIVDAANRQPVPGAVVIAFKPGVRAADVDLEKVDEQALSWGKSDAHGHVMLNRLVPRGQRYTVGVIAGGYKPLISDGALAVPSDAPSELDPWRIVRLERK